VCRCIYPLALAGALLIAGCGSSSSSAVSEAEANRLARHLLGLNAAECVPAGGRPIPSQTLLGRQRAASNFTCSGSRRGHLVTVEVTMTKSGTAIIDHCPHTGYDLCRELGRGGRSIGGTVQGAS
jgi:hypothetical protein